MEEPTQDLVKPLATEESKEGNLAYWAPFLGGVFSAGGMVDLRITNPTQKNPYSRVRPTITYSDNRKGKMEQLKSMFGGNVVPHAKKNSYMWYLHDTAAAKLGVIMKNFLPSRAQTIDAFKSWLEIKDKESRLDQARKLREQTHGKRVLVDKDEYKELVDNPLFLTGVFESRGALYVRNEEGQTGIFAQISSENGPLLEAIKDKLSGSVVETTEKGHLLTIGREGTGKLLQQITPHLLSPLDEYYWEGK